MPLSFLLRTNQNFSCYPSIIRDSNLCQFCWFVFGGNKLPNTAKYTFDVLLFKIKNRHQPLFQSDNALSYPSRNTVEVFSEDQGIIKLLFAFLNFPAKPKLLFCFVSGRHKLMKNCSTPVFPRLSGIRISTNFFEVPCMLFLLRYITTKLDYKLKLNDLNFDKMIRLWTFHC